MNTLRLTFLSVLTIFMFTSCSDDEAPQLSTVESEQVNNLFAPQIGGTGTGQAESGDFTKFDFSTGMQTTSETEWDIAFRGLSIIVNGGESQGNLDEPERTANAAGYITDATFSDVIEVNESLFQQDSESQLAIPRVSGEGWYTYNFMQNLVTANAGKVLVFRTRDGRYAKVEILSYYRNNPSNEEVANFSDDMKVSEARHYTFNYVYQPNEGEISF